MIKMLSFTGKVCCNILPIFKWFLYLFRSGPVLTQANICQYIFVSIYWYHETTIWGKIDMFIVYIIVNNSNEGKMYTRKELTLTDTYIVKLHKNLFTIYAKPGIYLSQVRILGTHNCGNNGARNFRAEGLLNIKISPWLWRKLNIKLWWTN